MTQDGSLGETHMCFKIAIDPKLSQFDPNSFKKSLGVGNIQVENVEIASKHKINMPGT